MTHALLTIAISLIVNFAVLAALKIGLRNGRAGRRGWAEHQHC